MAFVWFKLRVCNYRCAEHWALPFLMSLLLLRKTCVPSVLSVWGGNFRGASRAEAWVSWNLQSTWGKKTCGCYFESKHHSNCPHWHGSYWVENLCIWVNSKQKPEYVHHICKNRVVVNILYAVVCSTLGIGVSANCMDMMYHLPDTGFFHLQVCCLMPPHFGFTIQTALPA